MTPEVLERVPENARAGLIVMNADKPLSQPGVLKDILERLDEGQTTVQIAKHYGVSRYAVNRYLLTHAKSHWKAIQSGQAATSIEDQDKALDDCADGVSLGRVRERIGLAKWKLERVARDIYGDKLQVEHLSPPSLSITIVAAQEPSRVIDVTPEKPMESVEPTVLAAT